jgi:hypothetical protein
MVGAGRAIFALFGAPVAQKTTRNVPLIQRCQCKKS